MPATDETLAFGARPGDVIAGKYRVERTIAVGGMGAIVAAHHLQLDRTVALKFLLPGASNRPVAIERFLREARAAGKIRSEHVAKVMDVGQLPEGAPYMVMEYLQGEDLAVRLADQGPLPIQLTVDLVLQACEAIAEAHALGIVHRDLKPANLFCVRGSDDQYSIKVLDFGISKVTTPDGQKKGLTSTQTVLGSPAYMSPEQMEGAKSVDARADIWALGATLFELLAGRPPFDGETVPQLALQVTHDPTPDLARLRGDVPRGLCKAIETCLQKSPGLRYQDVGGLAMALAPFGSPLASVSVRRVMGTLRGAGRSVAPSLAPPFAPSSGRAALGAVARTTETWDQAAGPIEASGLRPLRIVAIALALGAAAAVALLVRSRADPGANAHADGLADSVVAEPPRPAAGASPAATDAGLAAVAVAPTSSALVVMTAPPLPAASGSDPRDKQPEPKSRPSLPAPRTRSPASPVSHAAVSAPPAGAAARPKKSNCDPPYVINADGDRQYKDECLETAKPRR